MDERSLLSTAVMKGALSFGCALLLGLPVSARSQTSAPGLDPRKPITQYVHDVWQIDQGLPQNSVFAMAQTRDGYLWVGTEAGLARFDGVAFTTHNTTNASGLPDNYVSSLLSDRGGHALGGYLDRRRGPLHRRQVDRGSGCSRLDRELPLPRPCRHALGRARRGAPAMDRWAVPYGSRHGTGRERSGGGRRWHPIDRDRRRAASLAAWTPRSLAARGWPHRGSGVDDIPGPGEKPLVRHA